MIEQERPRREARSSSRSGFDDIVRNGDDGPGAVTVRHGVFEGSLPVAEMAVGEIRRRFADRFDIAPTARAELDGRSVDDRTVVRAGQTLVFANHFGEKGAR